MGKSTTKNQALAKRRARQQARGSLDAALDLLDDYAVDHEGPVAVSDPLPSLLAQCEDMHAGFAPAPPARVIHHMACSGGTVISKCLAAMPNVVLLSEIDPLSRILIEGRRPQFAPTDLIYGARMALRPVDDETARAMFHASFAVLREHLEGAGRHLILRDHAHSQFCSDTAPAQRLSLREMLHERGPVRGVLTVRHPLDCYLSLIKNNWKGFTPFTLDEYARRHTAFLDRHAELDLYRYEDFVEDPDAVLMQICEALAVPFAVGSADLIPVVFLSGDSGRSSPVITHMPRRPVSPEIEAEAAQSDRYQSLCKRLGYRPLGLPVISRPAD
jgi:hypothetical protein